MSAVTSVVRTDGIGLGKLFDDVLVRLATLAVGMSEAALADAILNIKNKIVAGARGNAHRNTIQSKPMARFPRDHMICAGSISADAQRADKFSLLGIQTQS